MDLKSIITAAPMLRKLWKWLPGPLRWLVLGAAVVVWLTRRGQDETEDAGGGDAASPPPASDADESTA